MPNDADVAPTRTPDRSSESSGTRGGAGRKLSVSSYVLLGAVDRGGPCTPYDLKRLMAESMGPLLELAHSQVYEEAGRLAKAGLLDEAQEGTGRRRLTYRITDEGRRELQRWLRVPVCERMELRDVGLVKLALADRLSGVELHGVAEDHELAWRALLAEVGELADTAPLSLRYTQAIADAAVAFWASIGRSDEEPSGDD